MSGGKSTTATTTTSSLDVKDLFADLQAAADLSAATASESESEVDHSDSDDDDSKSASKKKLKSKKALENHSNMKKTQAGATNSYLQGSFQFSKDFSVSNPLTISEPVTISFMGAQSVYYPVALSLNEQKCILLGCFNATVRKAFTSPSSYGSGKKALQSLVAKDQALGQVRECKIAFYAAPGAPNPASTLVVNRDQLLEYAHMSLKTFNEKIVVGNTKLVTDIELSEHESRIPVISVCLAMYLIMQCKPNVQVYRKYKNPVEAMPLCLDLSWELSFFRMLRYAESALANYTSSSASNDTIRQQMAKYKDMMEKKLRKSESDVKNLSDQFSGIKHKIMNLQGTREQNVMLALVTKSPEDFKQILSEYLKGSKVANGAAVSNATASAGAKQASPIKPQVKTSPSAAATLYMQGSGAAPIPSKASANGMDTEN